MNFNSSQYISEPNSNSHDLTKNSTNLSIFQYPDLEWQPDPQREDEYRLKEIYQFYVGMLIDMDANYVVVKGQGENRSKLAEEAVKEFLQLRNF